MSVAELIEVELSLCVGVCLWHYTYDYNEQIQILHNQSVPSQSGKAQVVVEAY